MKEQDTFMRNMKAYRQKTGLTMEQLSEKSGISIWRLTKAQDGDNLPNLELLVALCHVFKCSLYDLVEL